jgi:hypothetical protein
MAKQVCWLSGHAGSGKSTIAQSFAEWLFADGKLGGSFFCSRESDQRSSTKAIFPTIAFQLATGTNPDAPKFRENVIQALKVNPKISSLALQNQLEKLLIRPARESGIRTVIVIDALDECRDEETTSIMLKFLDMNVKHLPNIKFFITSRPETHIRVGFRQEGLKLVTDVMVLHEVAALSVDDDIRVFLETKLARTAIVADHRDVSFPEEWPSKLQISALTKKAGGLFIFASTAVKIILGLHGNPKRQLDDILSKPDGFSEEGVAQLDGLYQQILERVFSQRNDKLKDQRRAILALLVVAREPLSITSIATILDVPDVEDMKLCLRSLHSVLVVPEDVCQTIRFHHKSFPDYLTDPVRCTDSRFYIDQDYHHFAAAQGCMTIMKKKLKRNICGLQRYSMNDSLSPALRDDCIDDSLKYSCRYGISHLILTQHRDEHTREVTVSLLDDWLKMKLLQWFEVLALLHELGRAVDILDDIVQWLSTLVRVFDALSGKLLTYIYSYRVTSNTPHCATL